MHKARIIARARTHARKLIYHFDFFKNKKVMILSRERMSRFFSTIAVLAAIVLMGAVIIYWAWYFFAPDAFHATPNVPDDPVAVLQSSSLFGSGATKAETATLPVTINGNVRLLGLIAQESGEGYAVFRVDDHVVVAQAGDVVGNGNTLLRVEPNAMVWRDQNNNERRIVLREENTGKLVVAAQPSSTQQQRAATSCVPSGFKGMVVRLNTELLQGVLMQPEAFYELLSASAEGLTVQADSGHAAMLGLQGGDQLHTANGVRLQRPEDITPTIIKPLAEGQSVHLTGMRNGQKAELLLVNVSVCSD
jgi:hypothetical protein